MNRADVTEKILSAKRLKGLNWKTICAEIGGGSPTYLTAGLMGQMKLRPDQAERAATIFGLGEEEKLLLQEAPTAIWKVPEWVPSEKFFDGLFPGQRHWEPSREVDRELCGTLRGDPRRASSSILAKVSDSGR